MDILDHHCGWWSAAIIVHLHAGSNELCNDHLMLPGLPRSSTEPAAASAAAAPSGHIPPPQQQQKRFRVEGTTAAGGVGVREVSGQNVGGGDGGDGHAHDGGHDSKPFLKRRSQKVHTHKVDWSHVKPRIVSRWEQVSDV